MTKQQKQAILAMRRRGQTYKAIANVLALSPNTVKSFCHRQNVSVQEVVEEHLICKYCGAPLIHHPGSKKKTFCNDRCRTAWWNENRKYIPNKRHHPYVESLP